MLIPQRERSQAVRSFGRRRQKVASEPSGSGKEAQPGPQGQRYRSIEYNIRWYRGHSPLEGDDRVLFAQHGQTLTGESPEHAQIVGSV